MKMSIKEKISKFLNSKKLDQTFSLFKKNNEEFEEIKDCNFPECKNRILHTRVVKSQKGNNKVIKILQVGLDTEYQLKHNTLKNDIISYQLYFKAYNIGVIFYNNPKTYKRLSLENFFQLLNEVFNHANYYEEIEIISHFSVAELNSFSDYKEFIKDKNFDHNLHMIQKSFTTLTPMLYKYTTKSNHSKTIKISLADTWLMSGKESLKNITDDDKFTVKKIHLEKSQIENMKHLLKTDKVLFDKYSIIDAYLTLEYHNQFYIALEKEFGITDRIITASSISAKVFQKRFKDNIDELLGNYNVTIKKKLPNGKIQNLTVKKFKSGIAHMKESYYGGRNETFCAGVSKNTEWGDYDLKSAYPTALLILQDIDWDTKIGISNNDWNKLSFNDMGIVTLKFKFKDSVMMPCFPIKDETTGGLIFVQEGETTIPIQELYMAYINNYLDMKNTQIITGYKFLRKNERLISELVTEMIQKRNNFTKKTLENKFYKLVNNALYGKFTQGVEDKNLLDFFNSTPDNGEFNYSDLEYNKQKQSPIYNPGIASFITSTVRAMVTEQMNHIEINQWAKVISVTTDGYMLNTKLSDAQIDLLNELPFTSQVEKIRSLIIKEKGVLELKHFSSKETQNISVKTRCYWMNDEKAKAENEMSNILISRGGAQSQGSKSRDLDYMTTLLAKACNNTKIEISTMTNSIDMLSGSDLIKKQETRSFNMDYDFKRLPNLVSATNEEITYKENENEIKKTSRITFNTKPYQNIKQYEQIKQNYITYLSTTNIKAINKVRTVNEMDQFLEYNQLRKLNVKVFKNQDNFLKYISKSFLVYYMVKNNLKPNNLNINKIASMLNLTNKQIHNMLRAKIFTQYVLDLNCVARMDAITYHKYEEEINYILSNMEELVKFQFINFIKTPIYKKIETEQPLIKIITKNSKNRIEKIIENNELTISEINKIELITVEDIKFERVEINKNENYVNDEIQYIENIA